VQRTLGRFSHGVIHPGVNALAGARRGQSNLAVAVRRGAKGELARVRLVRLLALLGAEGQIIVH
jgi:hypothetical protein